MNIIDERDYNKLENEPKLEPAVNKVTGYGSKLEIEMLGRLKLRLVMVSNASIPYSMWLEVTMVVL